MAENSTENTAPAGETTEQSGVDDEKKFTQADVDRMIADRLTRARSKSADETAKIQAEAQEALAKEKARADEAEKAVAALQSSALKSEVAYEYGVPNTHVKFLTGETREELEAAATELMALRGEQAEAPKGPTSDAIGRANTTPVKGSTGEQFADFFANL